MTLSRGILRTVNSQAGRGAGSSGRTTELALRWSAALAVLLLCAGCWQAQQGGDGEEAAPADRAPAAPPGVGEDRGVAYGPPLVITRGGTYRGNWESSDPDVPAVTVRTSEPVVIEHAHLRGRGHLVAEGREGVDVTVRDSYGRSLNPGVAGRPVGRFVHLEGARRAVIEHNELVGTAGILLSGYTGDRNAGETFTVLGNRARNIDGRMSNGSGRPDAAGFYPEDRWCRAFDGSCRGVQYVQFVQVAGVQGVPGIEIAWNEVVNEPGRSRVEDAISVYESSGTPASPIRIFGNFIDGAYPQRPEREDYSGGGIMAGDGHSGVAHVEAVANSVLNTTNYGIAIAAGRGVAFRDNRILSTGRLTDGTPVAAQNVGAYVWNIHEAREFGGHRVTGNLVGWEVPVEGARNDWWFPDVAEATGNRRWSGEVTEETLDAEYAGWRERARQAGVPVGPR